MSSMMYGTVVLAALLSKVSAFPMFYNDRRMGCSIPEMGFAGHGDPVANEMITITVMEGTTEVTEFEPGMEYTITVPAYTGTVNMWIHATAGGLIGTDPVAHPQADACMEASYSADAAATHEFTFTAPDTSDPVTFSVAQATGSSDAYNTATMDLPGAGGAAGAPTGTMTEEEEDEGAVEGAADDAVSGVEDTATDTVDNVTGGAFAVATGALAAAATAVAALVM